MSGRYAPPLTPPSLPQNRRCVAQGGGDSPRFPVTSQAPTGSEHPPHITAEDTVPIIVAWQEIILNSSIKAPLTEE